MSRACGELNSEQPVRNDIAPRGVDFVHGARELVIVVQAYVLIQSEVGRARDVALAIQELDGVVNVDAVTGPYDVVVLTEAPTVDELGKMVVSKVQQVSGITRTLTCSVVHL